MLRTKIIRLKGNDCPVVPLDTRVNEQSRGCQAIMVRGLSHDMSEETLDMYFSNRRKSGGYDIMKIFINYKEGTAVITFEKPDGKCK